MNGQLPGLQPKVESEEREITWSGNEGLDLGAMRMGMIHSSAVDATNTTTTRLRRGLVLGKRDTDGKWKQHDPTATDGTQIAAAVLAEPIDMLEDGGAATDRVARVLVEGRVRGKQLIGLDYRGRYSLSNHFSFDDDLTYEPGSLLYPRGVRRVAADYSVLASDHGLLFIATASCVFTLPTKANGLSFRFLQTADALLRVSGSADIVFKGSAGLNSVFFNTSSERIGSHVLVECVYVASNSLKWVAVNLGGTTASTT